MKFSNLFKHDDHALHFAAGDIIIKTGAESHHLFVILEGEAKIRYNDHTLAEVGPGEVFGELSLIDDEPACADVIAKTDLTVSAIDEKRFNFLVQEHPFFALGLMKVMTQRLRHMNEIS